ncbi:MAG: hypothetical protein IJQ67_01145 [Bacilli bacterium]|nr:hypothetical protein [Bacilli bacterium]
MEVLRIIVNRLEDNSKKEIAVPSDIPLWAFHYTLAKYFKFDVSGPYTFALEEDKFLSLAGTVTGEWRKQVGIWFMSPYRAFNEDDWCEEFDGKSDYEDWLERKTIGPYIYKGYYQSERRWKDDLEDFVADYADIVIVSKDMNEYGFSSVRPLTWDMEYDEDEFDSYNFNNLPIKYLPFLFDHGIDELVETLTLDEIHKEYQRIIYRDGYNKEVFTIDIVNDGLLKETIDEVVKTYMPIEI